MVNSCTSKMERDSPKASVPKKDETHVQIQENFTMRNKCFVVDNAEEVHMQGASFSIFFSGQQFSSFS